MVLMFRLVLECEAFQARTRLQAVTLNIRGMDVSIGCLESKEEARKRRREVAENGRVAIRVNDLGQLRVKVSSGNQEQSIEVRLSRVFIFCQLPERFCTLLWKI